VRAVLSSWCTSWWNAGQDNGALVEGMRRAVLLSWRWLHGAHQEAVLGRSLHRLETLAPGPFAPRRMVHGGPLVAVCGDGEKVHPPPPRK